MRKGTSVFRCNISQFLTRLEAIFDDYQLTPLTRVTRLPDFCDLIIADYIRTFSEHAECDWEGLKRALKREYRDDDSYQQLFTRAFLEALKQKGCTEGTELRTFTRQYTAISLLNLC